MAYHLLSLTTPHIAYACLGGFVALFGMFSLFIREKLYIGEACWAFLFGVIIGPYGAGIFDPRGWAGNEYVSNIITLEVTRVVLAVGVFAIGVELPKAYVARHWKSLLFLLGPVMTWGWFVSAGLIYAFIPGLDFLSSLAVAACLTPTDPILAAAVVGGKYADKHVPAHIRHLLSAEAGCNDGAAYPFLFISIYLIMDASPGLAVRDWFVVLWLYEICLSVAFGSALGFGFRHLMKFCQRKDLIDRQSYVAQYVSLAFLTIGIMTILGSDDLLASFCCGTAFAWDGFFNRQTEEAVFSSVIDLLFNVASFVYVGAWMPFDSFNNETLTLHVGRLIAIAVLILLLKRLPIMVALYKFIPDVKTFREALFSGHFGPVGIGAVYISTYAVVNLPKPSDPPANRAEFLAATIQPIVAFIVLCSVAIHGLSIPFFSLGRRVHSVSSRTWSRHASGPDWATYTRHVTRAEDVVINRDPDAMENGRAGLTEEEKTIMESRRTSIDGKAPREDAKKQYPPDGTEITMEWKEGSDKVVEQWEGPGKEVRVRDFGPSRVYVRSVLRLLETTFRERFLTFISVRAIPSEAAPKSPELGGEKASQDVSSPVGAGPQYPEPIPVTHAEGELDDEACEDNGNGSTPPVAWTASVMVAQAPSTSEKSTSSQLSTSTSATLVPMGNEPDIPEEDVDQRGRSAFHERKSSRLSSRPSFHHRRLESLLSDHSRDVSPSRSIRFADEPRSGTSTPRNGVLQNESSPPSPPNGPADDALVDDDAEATRGKVTFELPPRP
ncbi:Sodium/hydrogen exchanger family-domain-containing protein [Chiua virens]|nr:Sodium/hydrogen exchanger family-domain-containing protein [Chiua virens]